MIKVYIWKCVINKDKSLISYIIKGQIYLMAQTFIASYFIAWTIINYKNSLYFDPYSEHIARELNFGDEKSGQRITMVTWSYTCQVTQKASTPLSISRYTYTPSIKSTLTRLSIARIWVSAISSLRGSKYKLFL